MNVCKLGVPPPDPTFLPSFFFLLVWFSCSYQAMVDGLVRLVIGRFVTLISHAIVTIVLVYGKTPLIQIELDPSLTMDLRDEQFDGIDTWWVLSTATVRYNVGVFVLH